MAKRHPTLSHERVETSHKQGVNSKVHRLLYPKLYANVHKARLKRLNPIFLGSTT